TLTGVASYKVTAPSSYSLTDQSFSSASAPPGQGTFYADAVIPSTAPAGTYTFVASATYNGVTSTQTTTFSITGGNTTSPVTLTRAFTSDTNNVERTSFARGETVRLNNTRSNTQSSTL